MNLDPIILAELQRGGPPLWVSGRNYPVGFVVRSPGNLQSYVRVTAGAGSADPSGDGANWMLSAKSIEDAVALVMAAVGIKSIQRGVFAGVGVPGSPTYYELPISPVNPAKATLTMLTAAINTDYFPGGHQSVALAPSGAGIRIYAYRMDGSSIAFPAFSWEIVEWKA